MNALPPEVEAGERFQDHLHFFIRPFLDHFGLVAGDALCTNIPTCFLFPETFANLITLPITVSIGGSPSTVASKSLLRIATHNSIICRILFLISSTY